MEAEENKVQEFQQKQSYPVHAAKEKGQGTDSSS